MSLRRDNEFHSFVVKPATETELPTSSGAADATVSTAWIFLAATGVRWLRVQRSRWWWRVLALGAALLDIAWLAMVSDKLTALVPFYVLAFAALMPVVAVVAWLEQGGTRPRVSRDLALAVVAGLAAGVVSALALYSGWLKIAVSNWQGALVLAAGEEVLKTLAIVYFLWSPRVRDARDGLRVGLAATLGFVLAQMALASYLAYHLTVTVTPRAEPALFRVGVANMDHMLAFQLALQLLGEALWTATICAAIWRERGGQRFRVTPGLVVILLVVLVLHAAFNYVFANEWVDVHLGVAFLPVANVALAGASYGLLRFFLVEARERDTLGALPPSPLLPALGAYLAETRERMRSWSVAVSATASAGVSVRPAPPAPARQASPPRRPPQSAPLMEPPDLSEQSQPREPTNTEWLV